jgi:hypothetical protein
VGLPGSRTLRFRTCMGSPTAQGPPTARDKRRRRRCHPPVMTTSALRTHPISRLNSPARTYRYRRFAIALTDADARLAATVGRYSFGVGLSHSHLNAGLSRRTNSARLGQAVRACFKATETEPIAPTTRPRRHRQPMSQPRRRRRAASSSRRRDGRRSPKTAKCSSTRGSSAFQSATSTRRSSSISAAGISKPSVGMAVGAGR